MVYRVLCICILISALISSIVFPASATSIHYISNESELFSLENDPEAVYILTNDIYLESSHSMMFSDSENSFKGVLDGNGYTVYNLKIESNDFSYLAFIGFLGANGVVKDLNFENSVIKSGREGTFLSGVVAKNISGRIENCIFSGVLSVAGKVLDKEYYVCAMGNGDVVNSYYYLKQGAYDASPSKETPINSVSEHYSSIISYTESVNLASVESSSSEPSSSSKISSNSKTVSSSSKRVESTESISVYGDVSSNVITTEEEKAAPLVFYAAVFLLLLLLVYMLYTEVKFRKNQKDDKK